jgi:hypothetical protein
MRDNSPGTAGDFSLGSLGDDIAGAATAAAVGAAAKFLAKKVGRRVQQAMDEQVMPTMAARQQEALQAQITIAERYPDLCACLNDHVIFLVGGQRVLPMPKLDATLTVDRADALVAELRNG